MEHPNASQLHEIIANASREFLPSHCVYARARQVHDSNL